MKDLQLPRIGIIPHEGNNISFYSDGYNFTFMDSEYEPFNIKAIEPSDDGFIMGRTYDRYTIAIYTGTHKPLVAGKGGVRTNAYLVSTSNVSDGDITAYDGIEFVGGILNNLYGNYPTTSKLAENAKDMIDENGVLSFPFRMDGIEHMCYVGTRTTSMKGDYEEKISKTNIYLKIVFAETQSIKQVFDHYAKVKELLSFMVYRRNVDFSEAFLLRSASSIETMERIAQIYVGISTPPTEKHWYECIDFVDIGPALSELLTLIFSSTDKKPSFMLGFIPEEDKDLNRVSGTTVREVCSALECELCFIDNLDNQEDENIKQLVSQIKNIIRQHRKTENALSEKTYNLIQQSMKHWSMSASDRIWLLYHRYEKEIKLLNTSKIIIDDKAIGEFVKYGNNITHGSHRVMNVQVGMTTLLLAGLVYCCILERVGVSCEKIMELCHDHKILR